MSAPRNHDRDALALAACVAIVLPLIYMLLRLHGQGVAP
jgi:flagellar biogenesis protein FliO